MGRPKITEERFCSLEWCDSKLYAKELCRNHYEQVRRGTEPVDPAIKKEEKVCAFDECGRPFKSKGYCTSHYIQLWKGEELRPLNGWKVKDMGEVRRCYTCEKWKVRETSFYKTSRGTYQGECKPCMVKRSSAYNLEKKLRSMGVEM